MTYPEGIRLPRRSAVRARRALARLERLDVPTLRAALWTWVALRRTRRELAGRGLEGACVAPPPPLPAAARRGVLLVLRRLPASCLEGALVLQSWEAAHGAGTDVVIGVTGAADGFRAHAWLETMPEGATGTFSEIMRIPAPRA